MFLRFRRAHVDGAAELRAFSHDDLRRFDVSVNRCRSDELDAIIGRDVAINAPFHRHVLRVYGRRDARLRTDAKVAAEVDLSFDGALDEDRLRSGDRSFNGDVLTDERPMERRLRIAA